MKKGGKSRLFVPAELAWGKKGSGTKIPPNALLIFDVRLLDFW
jgi:FKBP-type peptidyl-prolyl cis-trans isomerase